MKYFIITVDTEGDNLWSYQSGDIITTNNTKFIPRFQELCEKYDFPPVYLTNYEMLMDDSLVKYLRQKSEKGKCEVGLHLHAWNNPPCYELQRKYKGNPYLVEYPETIMREKFDTLYKLFVDRIGCAPVSHRSGRWAMNETYFDILNDYNVLVDCSITPGINWSASKGCSILGPDYSLSSRIPHHFGNVYEVPVTIYNVRHASTGSIKHRIRTMFCGDNIWLRPANYTLQLMKRALFKNYNDDSLDYIQFMIHSSELMPAGSPYFLYEEKIEDLYFTMNSLFTYAYDLGYKGITLAEYYNRHH